VYGRIDAARQAREDPMTYVNQLKDTKQQLVLRKAALPLEMVSSTLHIYYYCSKYSIVLETSTHLLHFLL
jgi:hypothetical protein